MSPKASHRSSAHQNRRLFAYVALAAFAAQLLADVSVGSFSVADEVAFTAPTLRDPLSGTGSLVSAQHAPTAWAGAQGPEPFRHSQGRAGSGRTSTRAAEAAATIGSKVLNAMGAGAVASVIQAALSAVGEPIVNRVLVKRMKIMDAINDVSPKMMLNFFKTTLTTNFLKFPFFEAINAFCAAMPISPSVRGLFTGFVFTSATLPVTNYRYRKSMELPVNWGNIYEAYVPTVIRDIVYGIARNYCTIGLLKAVPQWTISSPQTLFIVVILGCLISAPFNEWRGYLLQSKGQELTFSEFFKPSNFVRSTSLGAIKQGLALAVGYWCAPPATRLFNGIFAAIKG
mmetsp:Transcript_30754/g.95632  ORF Transcript_30754/g.95632 Transcript_30754/m.95632 type:complete len:342 (-) Transcript_30754:49-1074(-)